MKKLILGLSFILLVACAPRHSHNMVAEPDSDGLMYGSVVESNIVLDAGQFEDSKIKVNIRNTSGDSALNIRHLRKQIENSLRDKGYEVVRGKDFTIKYDVNVTYSGHIRQDMSTSYAFLGGAAGGIAGYNTNDNAGTAIGVLAGATLGAILGSYVTDDTYITVTNVTIAVLDNRFGKKKKKITFNSSPALQEEERSGIQRFKEVLRNKVAVYAGGRNVTQSMIIGGVKDRLLSILVDMI